MQLLHMVKQHLKATGTSATRFGREAVGDPRLVYDLDHGRECRPTTAARVLAHIERKTARRQTDAHRELIGSLLARGGNARIVAERYHPWWSATFSGVRHALTIEGEEEVIERIVVGLADAEFDLPGHLVIDILAVDRSAGRVAIEALTIEDQ